MRFRPTKSGLALTTAITMILSAVAFFSFVSLPMSTPAMALEGSIFTVAPEADLTLASAQGKFEYDQTTHLLSVDGVEWELDASSAIEIHNFNQLVSLNAVTQLGNLLKTKATIICSQAKVADRKKPVIRLAIIHLHN